MSEQNDNGSQSARVPLPPYILPTFSNPIPSYVALVNNAEQEHIEREELDRDEIDDEIEEIRAIDRQRELDEQEERLRPEIPNQEQEQEPEPQPTNAPQQTSGVEMERDSPVPEKSKLPYYMKGAKYEPRANHAMWFAYNRLFKMICMNGGTVYGGAVRDYIKRTSEAKKYYKYCEDNEIIIDSTSYHNSELMGMDAYINRTLLPNDIDIFITEENFTKLMKTLYENFDLLQSMDNLNYLFNTTEIFKSAIKQKKYCIQLIKDRKQNTMFLKTLLGGRLFNSLEIKLDFIILKKDYVKTDETHRLFYPPFGKPDFDVNQLIMVADTNGCIEIKVSNAMMEYQDIFTSNSFFPDPIKLMELKKQILDNIIYNIENGIAVPVFPSQELWKIAYGASKPIQIDSYRLKKMLDKNYTLDSRKTLDIYPFVSVSMDDYIHNDEDKCVICLDTFSKKKNWYQFGCECKVKMHIWCYKNYLTNPTINRFGKMLCPHCRTINTNKCLCNVINYLASFAHKVNNINSDKTTCESCALLKTTCTKWFFKCKVCNHMAYENI